MDNLFALIQCADSLECFGVESVRSSCVQLVYLSPRMSPTCCFDYALDFIPAVRARLTRQMLGQQLALRHFRRVARRLRDLDVRGAFVGLQTLKG